MRNVRRSLYRRTWVYLGFCLIIISACLLSFGVPLREQEKTIGGLSWFLSKNHFALFFCRLEFPLPLREQEKTIGGSSWFLSKLRGQITH